MEEGNFSILIAKWFGQGKLFGYGGWQLRQTMEEGRWPD
jgi:hypothetical protein